MGGGDIRQRNNLPEVPYEEEKQDRGVPCARERWSGWRARDYMISDRHVGPSRQRTWVHGRACVAETGR